MLIRNTDNEVILVWSCIIDFFFSFFFLYFLFVFSESTNATRTFCFQHPHSHILIRPDPKLYKYIFITAFVSCESIPEEGIEAFLTDILGIPFVILVHAL